MEEETAACIKPQTWFYFEYIWNIMGFLGRCLVLLIPFSFFLFLNKIVFFSLFLFLFFFLLFYLLFSWVAMLFCTPGVTLIRGIHSHAHWQACLPSGRGEPLSGGRCLSETLRRNREMYVPAFHGTNLFYLYRRWGWLGLVWKSGGEKKKNSASRYFLIFFCFLRCVISLTFRRTKKTVRTKLSVIIFAVKYTGMNFKPCSCSLVGKFFWTRWDGNVDGKEPRCIKIEPHFCTWSCFFLCLTSGNGREFDTHYSDFRVLKSVIRIPQRA